ncbi:unnamed protein product [Dracunculus medinensis]|uniref:BAH domain-containing protein n=1 Tax=Dracunculus medinensis TaxID=318479 RepID=A0A0N4UQR5_DRAME|nr:unnamed protein product [Dracunculus medinensis]
MILYRDDCNSVKERHVGLSCVFARIASVNPFRIEDSVGSLVLGSVEDGIYEVDDYCYFLLETSSRPLHCKRVTVVPAEIEPVAMFQLNQFRSIQCLKSISYFIWIHLIV